MKVSVGVCAESLVWVGECTACHVQKDWVIQQCNSSEGLKQTMKPKTFSANVSWGKAGKKKKQCYLKQPELSKLTGRMSVLGGERRKLGVCCWSLTTAGRGVMSTERDWNRLFLGAAASTPSTVISPPLFHPSHTTMFNPHLSPLLLFYLSLKQQDSLPWFLSRPMKSMVSCVLLMNGSSELGESLRWSSHWEENGCSGCCHPHFSCMCFCCAWSQIQLELDGV